MQYTEAVKRYRGVVDFAFPAVNPMSDETEIEKLADAVVSHCLDVFSKNESDRINAVHVMGEMTLTFAIVKGLQQHRIKCIASTTRRETVNEADGWKNSRFTFCRFRKYI